MNKTTIKALTTSIDDKSSPQQMNWNRWYWFAILVMSLIHLTMAVYLDLTPDEAYYWELSRHLDWSYYDHPPMVAWIIAIFRTLLGDTVIAIRLPSIISIFISSRIIYLIGKVFLKSEKIGFWAVIILNFTPAGVALGFITTPDTLLALAWTIGIYSFLKAIKSETPKWWIITGVTLGFGALSKYNMIFFVPGIAITILAFPKHRKLIFTSRYWMMVVLAAIGTIPVIYWNNQHDWISFKFQFNHGLKHNNHSVVHNIGEFLGGQLGTIGPILYPAFWLSVIRNVFKSWNQKDEVRFFLAWLALPMMMFFVCTGTSSKVEANWPQIAYISLMLLLAEWITKNNYPKRLILILSPSFLLATVAIIHSFTLILPLPSKSDVSCRMHGWKEMGKIIRNIDAKTSKKALFIGQGGPLTSLVAFYGKIPSKRITEIIKSGNFRFWTKNRKLATHSSIVYIDVDNISNSYGYINTFTTISPNDFQNVASKTFEISKFNKKIRKINITTMKKSYKSFKIK